MSDIHERRLLQRTNLAIYLNVFDADSDTLLGNIIDINVCGFLLLTKQPLAADAAYNIKIELPKDLSDQEYITCDAVVRRCVKSVNPSFEEAGFEITEISPDQRSLIDDLEQALLLKFKEQ